MSAVLCCLIAATTQAAWAAADPAEDEAWKKEPAYGKEIIVGYNGGLCLGTFGIAQMKGFYEAEGLKTKIVRMAGGSSAQTDAIGTGKVDVAGDHIATMLVPTINGVRMKFTTGIHTGCKSLYVLKDSPIKSTKDLEGKYIAIPDGIGNSDHNIAMRFLNKDNVDPMKVKWKVVEAGASVLAMQNGEIAAALLGDQFAKQFLDNGTLRIIRSLTFDVFHPATESPSIIIILSPGSNPDLEAGLFSYGSEMTTPFFVCIITEPIPPYSPVDTIIKSSRSSAFMYSV